MDARQVCFGYTRVSTRDQADLGISLQAQAEAIKKKAEELGLDFQRIYSDPGMSGMTENRPQLKKLLEIVGNGECIIVFDISRLTRNMNYQGVLNYDFEKRNIRLISIMDDLDSYIKKTTYMANIKSLMATMEIDNTKIKIKSGIEAKKTNGEHIGRIPYGWKLKGAKGEGLIEHKEEQAIIKRIKDLVEGTETIKPMSYSEISRVFNVEKIPPPDKSKIWYPTTISRIYTRKPVNTKGRGDRGATSKNDGTPDSPLPESTTK